MPIFGFFEAGAPCAAPLALCLAGPEAAGELLEAAAPPPTTAEEAALADASSSLLSLTTPFKSFWQPEMHWCGRISSPYDFGIQKRAQFF